MDPSPRPDTEDLRTPDSDSSNGDLVKPIAQTAITRDEVQLAVVNVLGYASIKSLQELHSIASRHLLLSNRLRGERTTPRQNLVINLPQAILRLNLIGHRGTLNELDVDIEDKNGEKFGMRLNQNGETFLVRGEGITSRIPCAVQSSLISSLLEELKAREEPIPITTGKKLYILANRLLGGEDGEGKELSIDDGANFSLALGERERVWVNADELGVSMRLTFDGRNRYSQNLDGKEIVFRVTWDGAILNLSIDTEAYPFLIDKRLIDKIVERLTSTTRNDIQKYWDEQKGYLELK